VSEQPLGHDIHGLRALAITLCGYLPEITGVTTALNQELSQLADGDLGWRGPAAEAFAVAWRQDADAAGALAVVIGQTAGVVGELATELAAIHAALEQEAHDAAKYGVKVGTDMRPPPAPAGSPASAAEASERHWAQAYRRVYVQALADAQRARSQAAGRLRELRAAIVPGPEPAGTPARPPGAGISYRFLTCSGKAEPDRPADRIEGV
jgi:uncharacterized protein YukE